jgi:hypothetical protein
VANVDFSNIGSGTKWFESQNIQTCCALTSRATLRGLSNLFYAQDGPEKIDFFEDAFVSVFRSTLISACRASGKPSEIDWRALAGAPHAHLMQIAENGMGSMQPFYGCVMSAIYSVGAIASNPAKNSALAMAHAREAGTAKRIEKSLSPPNAPFNVSDISAIYPSFTISGSGHVTIRDSSAITSSIADDIADFPKPLAGPVWRGIDVPPNLQDAHVDFVRFLSTDPKWEFWHDWYLAMWDGTFDEWDLAYEVIKIEDAAWKAGAEAVASKICRIQTCLKTQVGPSLRKNDNSKWEIEPDVEIDQEPLSFAIAQVEVTLAAALTGNANNGLTDTSHETVLIRGACNSYREMPSVVATSFWNACMSLERNIGDVYPEDPALLVLKNVLYTSVEELCAQDNLIRDRVAKLAALETRRYPTQQEREDLKLVPQEVADEMTQPALDILQSDIDIVVATDKPPRANRARLVNWLTKIGSGIDKTQKNEKRVSWLLKLSGRIAGWFFDRGNEAE